MSDIFLSYAREDEPRARLLPTVPEVGKKSASKARPQQSPRTKWSSGTEANALNANRETDTNTPVLPPGERLGQSTHRMFFNPARGFLSVAVVLSIVALAMVFWQRASIGDDGEGPMRGAWLLTGEATNSVGWGATFKLEHTNTLYSGKFEWKRNGADAGTESFTGTYDPTTKNITLIGQQTTGGVVPATYVAKVAADRRSMTEGQWTSPFGPAGTWHAERIGE